jgi:hypothetical protein
MRNRHHDDCLGLFTILSVDTGNDPSSRIGGVRRIEENGTDLR